MWPTGLWLSTSPELTRNASDVSYTSTHHPGAAQIKIHESNTTMHGVLLITTWNTLIQSSSPFGSIRSVTSPICRFMQSPEIKTQRPMTRALSTVHAISLHVSWFWKPVRVSVVNYCNYLLIRHQVAAVCLSGDGNNVYVGNLPLVTFNVSSTWLLVHTIIQALI